MGSHKQVYIGPMVVCRNPRVVVNFTTFGCPACKCQLWDRSIRYCGKCGTPSSEFSVPADRKMIDAHQSVYAVMKDRLLCVRHRSDVDYMLPNITAGAPRTFVVSDLEEGPVISLDAEADLSWFREKYAADTEELRQVYGPDDVEVTHGIVVYYT